VALRIYFRIDLAHGALGIDHEAGALPELHAVPFGLPNSTSADEFSLGVGEQIDREAEFVAEILVRSDIVLANSHHTDSGRIELRLGGRE